MYPSFAEPLVLGHQGRRLSRAPARAFDLLVAAPALLALAPLLVLLAAAIWLESGRPIFFSQVRLGREARHFRMHKFRKFRKHGPVGGRPLTLEDDPRLTRVGGFLARTKLDELPQLWNILKGEMSIVGPRPESLAFADCFAGPSRAVLDHKPGIFGPSQVLFRSEALFYRERTDPEQFYRTVLFPLKAQIDLAYFGQRTLFRDVAWAVRGALAVFRGSSTPQEAAILVKEAEDRIDDLRDKRFPPSRTADWGVGEITLNGASRLCAREPELLPTLAAGARYARDGARARGQRA
jgi:lipopolysaccharide/colanic/teichoic acid biosynthesis glycosyltransferase